MYFVVKKKKKCFIIIIENVMFPLLENRIVAERTVVYTLGSARCDLLCEILCARFCTS